MSTGLSQAIPDMSPSLPASILESTDLSHTVKVAKRTYAFSSVVKGLR
jgi:hypothetical protein